MLTLEIVNDGTGDNLVGNYDWVAKINGREIDRGKVGDHRRELPWWRLAERVLWKYVYWEGKKGGSR